MKEGAMKAFIVSVSLYGLAMILSEGNIIISIITSSVIMFLILTFIFED